MAKRGSGQMRTTALDASVARAVPPALLGRRRLPPAVNDNRPSFWRLWRLAVGPVAIVALLAAIWWG
jgi:anti-sigma-K factor RskA